MSRRPGAKEPRILEAGALKVKMPELYTRGADQIRLAGAAMHLLVSEEVVRPTPESGGTFSAENEDESMSNYVIGAQERTRTSTALTAST